MARLRRGINQWDAQERSPWPSRLGPQLCVAAALWVVEARRPRRTRVTCGSSSLIADCIDRRRARPTTWSAARLLHDDDVTASWSLRPGTLDDAEWMADLKVVAMRPDLERLGYWDRDWARQRLLDTYIPENTSVITLDGEIAGCIAVRPESDALWIEHFYLHPRVQGHGLGGQILNHVMTTRREQRPFMLAIDRGSAVRRLYERHGFTYQYDDENGVDQVFSTAADNTADRASR